MSRARADELRALLARVEEATGRDLHLEADMLALFGGPQSGWPKEWFGIAYRPTDSLDDAVSLIAKMLPKWSLHLGMSEGLRYPIVSMGRSYPTNKRVAVEHRTAPLALIAALLSALISQEAENGR